MFVGDLVETVAQSVREAAAKLRAAGVAPEPLAEYVAERRVMLIKRAATMHHWGEVWRVGTLLVAASAAGDSADLADADQPLLYAAGRTTRAAARLHPGNQSISREERRDIAAAALQGGYPEGTSVHFDALPIRLEEEFLAQLGADSPIGVHDGAVRVRWRAGAPLDGAQTLAAYLAERVDLLVHPPQGAS